MKSPGAYRTILPADRSPLENDENFRCSECLLTAFKENSI